MNSCEYIAEKGRIKTRIGKDGDISGGVENISIPNGVKFCGVRTESYGESVSAGVTGGAVKGLGYVAEEVGEEF